MVGRLRSRTCVAFQVLLVLKTLHCSWCLWRAIAIYLFKVMYFWKPHFNQFSGKLALGHAVLEDGSGEGEESSVRKERLSPGREPRTEAVREELRLPCPLTHTGVKQRQGRGTSVKTASAEAPSALLRDLRSVSNQRCAFSSGAGPAPRCLSHRTGKGRSWWCPGHRPPVDQGP